jgi:hypothetical protein
MSMLLVMDDTDADGPPWRRAKPGIEPTSDELDWYS